MLEQDWTVTDAEGGAHLWMVLTEGVGGGLGFAGRGESIKETMTRRSTGHGLSFTSVSQHKTRNGPNAGRTRGLGTSSI